MLWKTAYFCFSSDAWRIKINSCFQIIPDSSLTYMDNGGKRFITFLKSTGCDDQYQETLWIRTPADQMKTGMSYGHPAFLLPDTMIGVSPEVFRSTTNDYFFSPHLANSRFHTMWDGFGECLLIRYPYVNRCGSTGMHKKNDRCKWKGLDVRWSLTIKTFIRERMMQ